MRTVELRDLVGMHTLTGVLIEDKYEAPDHYTKCRFSLDGKTYQADEDPDDGYRSSCRPVLEVEGDTPLAQFEKLVSCHMRNGEDDILDMVHAGRRLFSIGTDNSDGYYPWYVCEFTPEAAR